MKSKVIKSTERTRESRGFATINQCLNTYFDQYTLDIVSHIKGVKECIVEPRMGFLPHRHAHSEMVMIGTQGSLEQKIKDGDTYIIEENSIQFMHAGTGIHHYEYNPSDTDKFKCIAIEFEEERRGESPFITMKKVKNINNEISKIEIPTTHPNSNGIERKPHIFYLGSFDNRQTQTLNLSTGSKGMLLYNYGGNNIQINETIHLKKNDTAILWDMDDYPQIECSGHSQFVALEL